MAAGYGRIASRSLLFLFSVGIVLSALSGPPPTQRILEDPNCARYTLQVQQSWNLQSPNGERFDASGLQRLPDGRLLVVNDKEAGVFEIQLGDLPTARLRRVPGIFEQRELAALCPGRSFPFDLEALALDAEGRLYVSDETQRLIFRCDLRSGITEKLPIDWAPVAKWFSPTDRNASFEGMAVGNGKLYVANERELGRIIEVDLNSMSVLRDFQVKPPGVTATDVHYSDLAWFESELWVLCREHRQVLAVNPINLKVHAAFGYMDIELDPKFAYRHWIPYGFFEGLSVDKGYIWLCIDNNGYPRRSDGNDRRPQLFKCPRPDTQNREKN